MCKLLQCANSTSQHVGRTKKRKKNFFPFDINEPRFQKLPSQIFKELEKMTYSRCMEHYVKPWEIQNIEVCFRSSRPNPDPNTASEKMSTSIKKCLQVFYKCYNISVLKCPFYVRLPTHSSSSLILLNAFPLVVCTGLSHMFRRVQFLECFENTEIKCKKIF